MRTNSINPHVPWATTAELRGRGLCRLVGALLMLRRPYDDSSLRPTCHQLGRTPGWWLFPAEGESF